MNLHLLASPYLYLGIGVVVAILVVAFGLVRAAVRESLLQRPYTASGLKVLPAAVAAALLFKDSGVVSTTFLLGTTCAILLWYVLQDAAEEKRGRESARSRCAPTPT